MGLSGRILPIPFAPSQLSHPSYPSDPFQLSHAIPSHPIPSIPHSPKPMPCADVQALTTAPLIHPQCLHYGHLELH